MLRTVIPNLPNRIVSYTFFKISAGFSRFQWDSLKRKKCILDVRRCAGPERPAGIRTVRDLQTTKTTVWSLTIRTCFRCDSLYAAGYVFVGRTCQTSYPVFACLLYLTDRFGTDSIFPLLALSSKFSRHIDPDCPIYRMWKMQQIEWAGRLGRAGPHTI